MILTKISPQIWQDSLKKDPFYLKMSDFDSLNAVHTEIALSQKSNPFSGSIDHGCLQWYIWVLLPPGYRFIAKQLTVFYLHHSWLRSCETVL